MDDTNPTLTPLSLSVDNGKIFYFLKIKDQPFPTEKVKTRGLPGLKYQTDLVKNIKYNLNRQGLYYYEEIDENSLAQV